MSHDVAPLLKVSQISALLSAFSTWTSVPSSGVATLHSCDGDHESGDIPMPDDGGEEKGAAIFLPLVDSVDVRRVQYKLFVGQMRKQLSVVCCQLGLLFHTVLPRVTGTVAKFR